MEHKAKTGIVQILKVHWKRGITLRELSRSAGLSPDSLRNVFTRNWPRAEQIIAQALETTPDMIWPSRYLSKSEKITVTKITINYKCVTHNLHGRLIYISTKYIPDINSTIGHTHQIKSC